MSFQLSPGINVSEVDLTTVVPAVSTTAGAFAGQFQWGPVNKRILFGNEVSLVNTMGKPDTNTAISFFSAANFLSYGNNLRVVRVANTASYNADANTLNTNVQIANEDDFQLNYLNSDNSNALGAFAARYPGELGNSLKVSVCSGAANFSTWAYKSNFNSAANTSTWAASVGGAYDQMHIIVIDEDGAFTGSKGTVLEVFPYVSKAVDAKTDDGNTNYYKQVIFNQSKYIYAVDPVDYANTAATWGSSGVNTTFAVAANIDLSLGGGTTKALTDGDTQTGYDLFTNSDEVDISLVITGDANISNLQYIIDNISQTRKDCVTFISPRYTDVVNHTGSEADNIATWVTALARTSSYVVADSGWKYQYDKYNNTYRWIPLNADIAGLCVRTDQTRDPWFSPAGANRGAIKNAVKLSWNPNKAERDAIYSLGVNPVVSFPGQGILLYGDKTFLTQPSAFDRINVRRLFIILEKSISTAAKFSLFEFNDEFTRAQFVSIVEPFLRDVKGRRGIYDYRVVCDTTNNTQQVIDSNQFVGDIYIKPARSINYIQLNFIAARTGVDFTEIVGAV